MPRKKPAAAASTTDNAGPSVISSEVKSSATVTVACKIPNGVILQLCKPTTWLEDTPSGTRERVRHDKVGPRHFVQGPAYPNGQAPEGYPDRPQMAGGYALTTIPKDFWDAWLEQNRETSFIVNGQVFAQPTFERASSIGREQKEIRSGFEPLPRDMDAAKDDRLPKPIPGIGVGKIVPGDEMQDRVA